MTRDELREQPEGKLLHRTQGNPSEQHYINKFGEFFEVRYLHNGFLYQRTIMRDPVWGWSPSWDDCRKSVMDRARSGNTTLGYWEDSP